MCGDEEPRGSEVVFQLSGTHLPSRLNLNVAPQAAGFDRALQHGDLMGYATLEASTTWMAAAGSDEDWQLALGDPVEQATHFCPATEVVQPQFEYGRRLGRPQGCLQLPDGLRARGGSYNATETVVSEKTRLGSRGVENGASANMDDMTLQAKTSASIMRYQKCKGTLGSALTGSSTRCYFQPGVDSTRKA